MGNRTENVPPVFVPFCNIEYRISCSLLIYRLLQRLEIFWADWCQVQTRFPRHSQTGNALGAFLQTHRQSWIKFLDPWVQDFYPVMVWGAAPSKGERNSRSQSVVVPVIFGCRSHCPLTCLTVISMS